MTYDLWSRFILNALAPTEPRAHSKSVVPTGRLRLRTDWHSATVVRIIASGEVDASNSDDFAQYVFRFGANSRRLILDLADVEFFGVECFSVLDMIGDRCTKAAVAWTVVPSPAVARVLHICDPHRVHLPHGLITKQRRGA